MVGEWTPELTINDDLLDHQHVDLFRKLDEAADALKGPPEALDAAVSAFADSLMGHITMEERVMEELLYPERTRHKSSHELFVADFERMRTELRASGATPLVADWVRRRLPEWLRFHIRVNDQPFATWALRRRAIDLERGRARKSDTPRSS